MLAYVEMPLDVDIAVEALTARWKCTGPGI